jgi:hypothetical protein
MASAVVAAARRKPSMMTFISMPKSNSIIHS